MTKIPKRIIQFCHNKDEAPDDIINASKETRKSLNDYEYIFADDELVKDIIINDWDHRLYDWYCRNQIPASRADLARLLLVYNYGGIYVDLSMQMKSGLDDFLDNDLILLKRDDFLKYKDDPNSAHFTNSIIGAPVFSEVVLSFINRVRLNFFLGKYNYDVINCTGPGVINSLVKYCQGYISIHSLSFKESKGKIFDYVRVKGFSNTWTHQQKNGILISQDERNIPQLAKGLNVREERGYNEKKPKEDVAAPSIVTKPVSEGMLHLHFGWPKVGSTTIQDFFKENGGGYDYVYPLSGRPNNVRAHHQLVKNRFKGPVADNFINEVKEHKNIVVSSEQGVVDLFKDGFAEGLAGFLNRVGKDFKIYVYLKNIFSFLESAYSQCLKTDLYGIAPEDYRGDINDFLRDALESRDSHLLRYAEVVNKLVSIVGEESVVIRCVNVNMPDGDVLSDFLGLIGYPVEKVADFNYKRSNVSLGVFEKALLRNLNEKEIARPTKAKALMDFSSGRLRSLPQYRNSDFCYFQEDFEELLRVKENAVHGGERYLSVLEKLTEFRARKHPAISYYDLCDLAGIEKFVSGYKGS